MSKNCKVCGEANANPLASACSIPCAIEYNRAKKVKKYLTATKTTAGKRKANKTDKSHQKKLTQKAFNKLRVAQELRWFADRGLEPECISCGRKNMDWCCGHFKTTGSSPELRFDEKNTFLQCNRYCNMGLSGNIYGTKTTRGYHKGLLERFGAEAGQSIIDYLESPHEPKKWEISELEQMRSSFNFERRKII